MYLALIAIFGVFGSWAVWKRNPLFSAGRTWRIVGGMGLGIAAFVALDILLVNLTIHSSPWVAGGSLGLLIIVSVMGMYLISRAFTKPKEQPLPVGIPLVTVHRQRVWLWTRRGGIFIAGLGLLGLVLPYGFNIAVWTIAGFTLFMALFLVPIGYMTARDRDRALTGVETMPWVHWQFSDEQWKAITALEVDRARAAATGTFDWKKQWKTMAVSLVLMVLLARAETSSWTVSLAICGGSVAFIAAIIWLSRMDAKNLPGRKERAMAKAARDAYFADGGLFWEGGFSTWLALDLYLVAASIDEHAPRTLVLDFEQVVSGRSGSSICPVEQRILIPDGAEADVRSLQEKLSAKCPRAAVTLC